MLLLPLMYPAFLCGQQSHCRFCKMMGCIHQGLYLYLKMKDKKTQIHLQAVRGNKLAKVEKKKGGYHALLCSAAFLQREYYCRPKDGFQ